MFKDRKLSDTLKFIRKQEEKKSSKYRVYGISRKPTNIACYVYICEMKAQEIGIFINIIHF